MVEPNEHPIEVTEENFGALPIQGLEEARAIGRGSAQAERRVRRALTAREAEDRTNVLLQRRPQPPYEREATQALASYRLPGVVLDSVLTNAIML
jgi:hypothetical protein